MRIGVALRLGRVSNLPTVWTNVAAGIALAGGAFHAAATAALLAGLSLLYVAGMYLNDFFDRDVDAAERPLRPIPSGAVMPGEVLAAGTALLAAGVATAGAAAFAAPTGSPAAALTAAAALAAAVVAYDAIHKRTPLAVLLMAACRALIPITAAFTVAGRVEAPVIAGAAAAFAYITGMTAVARHETRRQVSARWPLALLVAPVAVAAALGRNEPMAIAMALGAAAWIAAAVRPLLRGEADVPLAVSRLIAGICLVDASLIAGRGHLWIAAAAAAAAPLTRLLQRRIPGT